MTYFHLLSDPHMNYTLNRPLADGEATSRIAEAKTLAPKIKDIDTWTSTFLEAASARNQRSAGRMRPRTTIRSSSFSPPEIFETATTMISPAPMPSPWRV